MKFSDIEFGESGRADRPGLGLVVPCGVWVGKSTFELAWKLLVAEHLNWVVTKVQCAEDLCGSAVWKKYRDDSRCFSLGRAVKYFSVNEMIPWEEANPKEENCKRRYLYLWPSVAGDADSFRQWRLPPNAIAKTSNDSSAHR